MTSTKEVFACACRNVVARLSTLTQITHLLNLKKESSMPKGVAAFPDESLYVLALFDGEVHVISGFQAEELNYS
jgi:hypothetical protein